MWMILVQRFQRTPHGAPTVIPAKALIHCARARTKPLDWVEVVYSQAALEQAVLDQAVLDPESFESKWIPAFAGMTDAPAGMTDSSSHCLEAGGVRRRNLAMPHIAPAHHTTAASLKIGRYIATTMEPTMTPSITTISGSIRLANASTALSTSCS